MYRRAVTIDEESCGRGHPNVAIRLNNLAQLLKPTNRAEKVEPMMRRTIEIDEKNFGPKHPNIAIGPNNLAKLVEVTNFLAKAEPLMRRHLEIFHKFTRATDHPHLQGTVNNYAGPLMEMGKSQGAVMPVLRELALELFD